MKKITKVILGAALVLVFIGAFSGAAAAVQSEEPGIILNTNLKETGSFIFITGETGATEEPGHIVITDESTSTEPTIIVEETGTVAEPVHIVITEPMAGSTVPLAGSTVHLVGSTVPLAGSTISGGETVTAEAASSVPVSSKTVKSTVRVGETVTADEPVHIVITEPMAGGSKSLIPASLHWKETAPILTAIDQMIASRR